MKIVLLPGLDGTAELFAPFVACAPEGWRTQVIAYPRDGASSYDECIDIARDNLPGDEPYLLLGESFSGPVAIQLAAESPPMLAGLILSCTFVRRPHWSWLGLLPWVFIFSRPLPGFVVRRLLGDPAEHPLVAELLRVATATVQPQILAGRMRAALEVDATEALRSVSVPTLYLRAAQDAVVGRRALTDVQAALPEVQVTELACAHMLLQILPAQAWQAIEEYRPGVWHSQGALFGR